MWTSKRNEILFYEWMGSRFRLDASKGAGEVQLSSNAAAKPDQVVALLESAAWVLAHGQGTFHLHAAAVCRGRLAALLVGPSGSGKSTTALALAERGFDLLADDQLILERAPSGDIVAKAPPANSLRLFEDTFRRTGRAALLERARPIENGDKLSLPYSHLGVPLADAAVVRSLFILRRADDEVTRFTPLPPSPALHQLCLQSAGLANHHGQNAQHLALLKELASLPGTCELAVGADTLLDPTNLVERIGTGWAT